MINLFLNVIFNRVRIAKRAGARKAGKLRRVGQSIIEYVIILVVVGVTALIFANDFFYDKDGIFRLFVGYVESAKNEMFYNELK